MPKIVLINPPSPFLISDKVFPPLGICYISAYLKKHGYDPEIIDLAGKKKIPEIDADIIGLSAVTPQYPYAQEILKELKYRRKIKAQYVIGGPHATCAPDSCRKYPSFDTVVRGEGEETMLLLAKHYPLRDLEISNLVVEDINTIPFPDRTAIDIYGYKYNIDDVPATTMITSRGCPYSCAFCSSIYPRMRQHSASYVIEEIKEVQKLGYEAVHFFDDIFILNKKRLFKICEYLGKERIIWRCFIRADIISEEVMKVMAQSGCKEVGIGIESGSQKILNVISKGTTVEQNTKSIELTRKYGIRSKAFIIIGLPGESKETIKETEQFIQSVELDDVDFTILQVFPDTDIYKNPQKYDLKFERGTFYKGMPNHYNECSPISTRSLSFEEIVNARDRLEKKFKRW